MCLKLNKVYLDRLGPSLNQHNMTLPFEQNMTKVDFCTKSWAYQQALGSDVPEVEQSLF